MRIVGPAQFAPYFAWSIASAGDFNGDGFEDLVVAGSTGPEPSSHGRVYFGGPGADSIEDVVLLRDPLIPRTIIVTPVARAGDMNGDGFGDIIVTTPTYTTDVGQAYVYFGGRSPNGVPDLKLHERPFNEPLSSSIYKPSAAAADFNGDGFDDVLLGAPGANIDPFGDPLGRAYLYLGGAAPDGEADLLLETPSKPIVGESFLAFGGVVAPAGDVNGDLFEDFLVAPGRAVYQTFWEKTFVYLGGTRIDSIPDASLHTGAPYSGLGAQGQPLVTTAGDLNGDGFGDFAAVSTMPPPSGSGSVVHPIHLYLGNPAMTFDRNPDLAFELPGERTATSVSGGRDVNGDGHPDLSVGSGLSSSAYVYLGGPGFDALPDITVTGDRNTIWFGAGLALVDWTGDGVADIAVTAPNKLNGVPPQVFVYDLAEPLPARVLRDGERRPIPIADSAPAPLRMRFEPVDESYASGDVDPASIRLRSKATGEVSEISAIAGKASAEGDWDRNGVTDLLASFSGADLARLFSNVVGRKTVDVTLEGRLRSRRRFEAPVSLTIVGTGPRGGLTAAVQPNPLNPRGTLSFRTESPGPVTARLFDLHGRCVLTLLRRAALNAGDHQIPIDDQDETGRPLASGVYFYRIDSPDGTARGRLVVAK